MNFNGFPFNGILPPGMGDFFNNQPQNHSHPNFGGAPAQASAQNARGQNSFAINEHNCHKRVRDPVENLNLGGHNNKLEIAATTDSMIV